MTPMLRSSVFTYQTRLSVLPAEADAALSAYAEVMSRIERKLFARIVVTGKSAAEFKNEFVDKCSLTARQFNAIRVSLEGKMASIRERRPGLIEELDHQIARARKVIDKLQKRLAAARQRAHEVRSGRTVCLTCRRVRRALTLEEARETIDTLRATLHQKQRRLGVLEKRKERLEQDQRQGAIRLCFGSRKLFRAQFALEENGYRSQEEWKADWKASRSGQFFVLGSKDEKAGNQTCVAEAAEGGSLTLRLRLPNALGKPHGEQLTLTGVRFAYGHEAILAALSSSRRITRLSKTGKKNQAYDGTAVSYRFLRDAKGWRVFVSVEAAPVGSKTDRLAGAFGIDVNLDHLALAETDRFGNLIETQKLDLPVYGKTEQQAKALIGDVAVTVAKAAAKAGKPVIIEQLDFRKKKAELEGLNPAAARRISSFAYSRALASLRAACFRAGVEVIEVNSAFTSVIGAVNHARRHGISIHQGAALAIARRGLRLCESPARAQVFVPTRSGGHVTFPLPVRNRAKHVWSHWSKIHRACKAALAAHARSGPTQGYPAPLPRPFLASRATLGIEGAIPSRESSPALFG